MSPGGSRLLIALRPHHDIGVLRRLVDIAAILVVAPLVVPCLLVLAVAIKVDSPGPVLFGHERLGAGGRRFRVLKLRTMVADAASRKHELADRNTLSWPDFKVADDPRVTRVGQWLRTSSLDELPQLWHVLRGEMTLVGPRACSIDVSDYKLWQTERLDHTPGLFGSWQAHHRATSTFDERCRIEIRERRDRTPLRDLVVSAQSFAAIARRDGAV